MYLHFMKIYLIINRFILIVLKIGTKCDTDLNFGNF